MQKENWTDSEDAFIYSTFTVCKSPSKAPGCAPRPLLPQTHRQPTAAPDPLGPSSLAPDVQALISVKPKTSASPKL